MGGEGRDSNADLFPQGDRYNFVDGDVMVHTIFPYGVTVKRREYYLWDVDKVMWLPLRSMPSAGEAEYSERYHITHFDMDLLDRMPIHHQIEYPYLEVVTNDLAELDYPLYKILRSEAASHIGLVATASNQTPEQDAFVGVQQHDEAMAQLEKDRKFQEEQAEIEND